MSNFIDTFSSAVDVFDGNNPAPLKGLVPSIGSQEIDQLLELQLASQKDQTAATWLVKASVDSGLELSSPQVTKLVANLAQSDEWGAIIHTFQVLEHHQLSITDAKTLMKAARGNREHKKTIVRAWALFAMAQAATVLEDEQSSVESELESALAREKGSVAVRARKGLELLNL